MNRAKMFLIAAGTSVAMATGAAAADIPMAPAAPPPPPPPPVGVDWGGFYVGMFGDLQFVTTGGPYDPWLGFGARAGFNIDSGAVVFGFEATAEYSFTIPTGIDAFEATGVARIGFEVAGGKALIFAVAGGGYLYNITFGFDAGFWTAGGGLEYRLTDAMSMRIDYRYQGFPAFPAVHSHNIGVGLNLYLGQ